MSTKARHAIGEAVKAGAQVLKDKADAKFSEARAAEERHLEYVEQDMPKARALVETAIPDLIRVRIVALAECILDYRKRNSYIDLGGVASQHQVEIEALVRACREVEGLHVDIRHYQGDYEDTVYYRLYWLGFD